MFHKLVQDAQFLPQCDVAGEWLCPVDNYGMGALYLSKSVHVQLQCHAVAIRNFIKLYRLPAEQ